MTRYGPAVDCNIVIDKNARVQRNFLFRWQPRRPGGSPASFENMMARRTSPHDIPDAREDLTPGVTGIAAPLPLR